MFKHLLPLLALILLTGCSVFGYETVEHASYTVLEKDGRYEIRQYAPQLIAKTTVKGDYKDTTYTAFRRIADFIFGANKSQAEVAMTAPVFQEQSGQKIAMTAPVVQKTNEDSWTMWFVMPKEYSLETLPTPDNSDVVIEAIPAKKMAVYQYSGFLNAGNIAASTEKLEAWVNNKNLTPVSSYRSAGYNRPWTLPFLRRNEVMVEIP